MRRRSGIAVDRLVVVTDAEDAERGARQESKQEHVSWCQVLELIDQEQLAPPLRLDPHVGLREDRLEAEVDLLVEVHRTSPRELTAVPGEDLGEPVDVPVELSLHGPRAPEPQSDARQRIDPRCSRVRIRATRKADQRREEISDLELVDGGDPSSAGCEAVRAVQDRERKGIERADMQPGEVTRTLHHLELRALVEGDERKRLTWHRASEQVPGALGQHTGLARPRRGDDPSAYVGLGDGGQLVSGKLGGESTRHDGLQGPTRNRLAGNDHDRLAAEVASCPQPKRASVAPRLSTIGEEHVGSAARGRTELGGSPCP